MAMEFSYNVVLEHVELNNMLLAAKRWGVLSGLGVTQRAAGVNMSVDVAAGTCYVNSVLYTESAVVNVAIATADTTNPRKDLITYDTSAGNPAAVTGTPAVIPIPPDIPSGDILLALIDVAANDSTIDTADITDKSILVVRSGWFYDGTKIHTAAAVPNAWTNKDLSSYVGSNRTSILLKIKRMSGFATHVVACRVDGDTDNFYLPTADVAESSVYISTINDTGYMIVPTSSSGIIEWKSDNSDTWDIWLVGYWV